MGPQSDELSLDVGLEIVGTRLDDLREVSRQVGEHTAADLLDQEACCVIGGEMEQRVASDELELLAETRLTEPRTIKEEPQIALVSIKQEAPDQEEAGLDGCPEVTCVRIKEEMLDLEPTAELSSFPVDRTHPDQTECECVPGGGGGGSTQGAEPGQDPHGPRTKVPCSQPRDPEDKPYECGACGKSFYRKAHLRHHSTMHTGEKPHHCENCDKRFCLRRSLEAHQRRCVGRHSYCCPTCGDVFQSFSNLYQHRRIHDTEKSFECVRCGQSDRRSSYYRQHQSAHQDEQPRPFLCLLCERELEDIEKR
ncbi:hypothetical protein GJAV_G00183270 [Gymnothorax javanicus]|nr:hypothetical protein GJAV_G00183270 [Gymnothorax javanicus]